MKFNIYDNKGNLVECEVIGMFKENNKNFIIYTDGTMVDGEKEVYASLYELNEENNITLLPITNESDWDLVDTYLEEN